MKLNQKGFGAIEGLLVVIALTLIVGVGFYVVNSNKDNDKSNNAQITTAESAKKTETVAQPQQSQKSDKELIVEAVRKDATTTGLTADEASKLNVQVDSIVGSNAQGNVPYSQTSPDSSGGGAAFIANKDSGEWKVIYRGQEKPGKDIGTKYNLPADWYSTDY